MGCVPNKKLPVHPTTPSLKTSKVRFTQQPRAPPPPSFAPDISFHPPPTDQPLNSSQVGSNFLTASRIAGYDLEQQTKQNTYLNSLPMNQKLRASNISVTSTLPPSSMVPPLPPLSAHNMNGQERHQMPRMPTPYPQQASSGEYQMQQQQQVSFGQHNYQYQNQEQIGQGQKHEMVAVPQFPTSPTIPMVDQTVVQNTQIQQVPQFGQPQQILQTQQNNQIRQVSVSPQHQPPQIPHFPQSYHQHQPQQPPQLAPPIPQPPMIPRPPQITQMIQNAQTPQIPQPPKSSLYSQSPSRSFQPSQFGGQNLQFQVPTINTRPVSSTTSIQVPSQIQINHPQPQSQPQQPQFQQQQQQIRPVSPNIIAARQGQPMMPVNQDLLRQIMRETHINDEGFKQIFVQRMDFGRVK